MNCTIEGFSKASIEKQSKSFILDGESSGKTNFDSLKAKFDIFDQHLGLIQKHRQKFE